MARRQAILGRMMRERSEALNDAAQDAPREGDRRRGIDRVIMLLEALLARGVPMRPGEIARLINAPRSTTYEIVTRLIEAEMLEPTGADGSVFFGRAMHLYGHAYGRHDAVYKRLAEALERLSADAGATAQVCTLKGNKYIVFDCRDGPGPFRITSDVGIEVPIPWTASGRLLLSHMSNGEIRAFIPPEDYRLPDGRVISPDRFLADIATARDRGYCETSGLADRFTLCMAAPIRERNGIIARTLCLVLPVDTPEPRRSEVREMLCDRARSLSLPAG